MKKRFEKDAKTPAQLVELLKDRGLLISEENRAERYLMSIGYYRLSAYFSPFQDPKDQFIKGASFDDILDLYIFDRKLRLHVIDALERIEVAVRSVISNSLCEVYGSHWYEDKNVFDKKFIEDRSEGGFQEFLGKIKKQAKNRYNDSCCHYCNNYNDPALPPAWMIIEFMPMGTWSIVYSNLKDSKIRQRISKFFSFKVNDLYGWLHALTLIRNCCAHHNRFWNRIFRPNARNIPDYTYKEIPIDTPYTNLALVHTFLSSFTKKTEWSRRLFELTDECPVDIHQHMKFPVEWTKIPFWKLQK